MKNNRLRSLIVSAAVMSAFFCGCSDNSAADIHTETERTEAVQTEQTSEQTTVSFTETEPTVSMTENETTTEDITSAATAEETSSEEIAAEEVITEDGMRDMLMTAYPGYDISDLYFSQNGYGMALLLDTDLNDFGCPGKLVYIGQDGITEAADSDSWNSDKLKVWPYDGYDIICADEVLGATALKASAWKVCGDYFTNVTYGMVNCESIMQVDKEYYLFTASAYDAVLDTEMDMKIGHTWKDYYLKWDGESFTELGGIPVSEEQFRELKGGSGLLDAELSDRCSLGEIYYRENGIVNINFITEEGTGMRFTNITAMVNDGSVVFPFGGNDYVRNDGSYMANAFGADREENIPCISYPDGCDW